MMEKEMDQATLHSFRIKEVVLNKAKKRNERTSKEDYFSVSTK